MKVHIYAEETAQKSTAHGDDGSRNQQGNKRFNGFNHYSPAASFTCSRIANIVWINRF